MYLCMLFLIVVCNLTLFKKKKINKKIFNEILNGQLINGLKEFFFFHTKYTLNLYQLLTK